MQFGRRRWSFALALISLVACERDKRPGPEAQRDSAATPDDKASSDGQTPAAARSLATVTISHGELDTRAPDGSAQLAAVTLAAPIYDLPKKTSKKLGYVRLGGAVSRDNEALRGGDCKGTWYRVYPAGYGCTEDFTTDLEHPLVRASVVRPDLTKPMPYHYGFVRATAPQYLRIPTRAEQLKSEFGLEEHLTWYQENAASVQQVELGANDVPLDARGVAAPGLAHPPGFRPSTSLSRLELFGSKSATSEIPFWLAGGSRAVPNVSAFQVPEYAVFADRVRRHAGLSFVSAFEATSDELTRAFGITVDLRLIPLTKVKPDMASPFHGIEIPEGMQLPFAWINRTDASVYQLIKGKDLARPVGEAPRRSLVLLSGNARIKEGKRFLQTRQDPTRWLLATDASVVHEPDLWPEPAEKGQKWIDISVAQQTLVLYQGKVPKYATMISSGRDRFGDPKKDLATPLGDFRIQSKHIAAAMDSEEHSQVSGGEKEGRRASFDDEAEGTIARIKAQKTAGKKLSAEDERRWSNIQKGRHPEYGITTRRGSTAFELRDVPWIQYFSAGFALHGAYWHDVFGIPRSHGCVNLAPIDARLVFLWTDPPVPAGWHGVNVTEEAGEGTWVHIRK